MESIFQGESSHAGIIKTIKNGLGVVVEHSRACKTVFRRSYGSKLRNDRI